MIVVLLSSTEAKRLREKTFVCFSGHQQQVMLVVEIEEPKDSHIVDGKLLALSPSSKLTLMSAASLARQQPLS